MYKFFMSNKMDIIIAVIMILFAIFVIGGLVLHETRKNNTDGQYCLVLSNRVQYNQCVSADRIAR